MSNIAYTSFNTMLVEFVSNLADVFDDNEGLKTASNTLSGFLELDPNTSVPLEKFHETFAEHAPLMLALTSKNMTPDMMTSVQSITDSYMQKVRSGEISEEDATNPLTIMAALQDNAELKKIMEENS